MPCDQARSRGAHGALGAAELWEQVAHVDPVGANTTVSEYNHREAGRHGQKRAAGKWLYDRIRTLPAKWGK